MMDLFMENFVLYVKNKVWGFIPGEVLYNGQFNSARLHTFSIRPPVKTQCKWPQQLNKN